MSRVLVVDDSATDRCRVVGILKAASEPLDVEVAAHGREALQKMNQMPVDLVVTDLIMPEMDGLALVDQIRRDHPLVPTILMTSKGTEEIAVDALRRGAASYVPKRLLGRELLATVCDILELTGKERNLSRLMQKMTSNQSQFELDNDRRLCAALVGYLQDLVTQVGLCDDADRMRVGVALEEALVNALYHGNLELGSDLRETDLDAYQQLVEERRKTEPYRDRRIRVAADVSQRKARFVIRDEGPGFNPDSLPDPTDPANLERISGRGVLLMRTFMDEIQYNAAGNEVTLKKFAAQRTQA